MGVFQKISEFLNIRDPPLENQAYCAKNDFLIKVSIANCQLQPLNWCSIKFEVSSPCSHGDISKNTPGSTVLKFSTERNEMRYVHCNRKSVYAPFIVSMCVGPAHQIRSVQWLLNARTRAVANISIEKTSVSKDRNYTKLKNEVTGDLFVCSCHTSLTATGPCNERSM